MAHITADRISERSYSTGLGDMALAGAVDGSYLPFSMRLTDGDTCHYLITGQQLGIATGQWELGLGTYDSGALARTAVYASSNADAAVTFSAGQKFVSLIVAAPTSNTAEDWRNALELGPLSTLALPGGTDLFLREDGTWAAPPAGGVLSVTGTDGVVVDDTDPDNLVVSAPGVADNAADIAAVVADLGTVSTLDYPGGTGTFLRADGLWAAPPGGGGGTVVSVTGTDGVVVDNTDPTAPVVTAPGIATNAAAIALKAPLASPTLTGTPLAPTATAGTNTTQIATTAFVTTAAGSKASQTDLDAAEADIAANTAAVATKVSLAGDTMTGALEVPGVAVTPVVGVAQVEIGGSGADAGILKLHAKTAGGDSVIQGYKAGALRWQQHLGDHTSEYTGNAGSDFRIDRYNEAGSYLGSPLTIVRSDGSLKTQGSLTIRPAGTDTYTALTLDKPTGATNSANGIYGMVGGAARWRMLLGNDAETGSNAGSNFYLTAFNDAGLGLLEALTIARSTGLVSVRQLSVSRDSAVALGKGWYGQRGSSGTVSGNVNNFNWSGSAQEMWVDSVLVGTVNYTSDERFKHSIEEEPRLPGYRDIRVISYRWQDRGVFKDDGGRDIGFSAQNLDSAFPMAVSGSVVAVGDDGEPAPASVMDRPILAMTVKEVQYLLGKVEQLEARITELESK